MVSVLAMVTFRQCITERSALFQVFMRDFQTIEATCYAIIVCIPFLFDVCFLSKVSSIIGKMAFPYIAIARGSA